MPVLLDLKQTTSLSNFKMHLMEQVKLSRNHAHKYLLYVFHSTEKPQVKMLEPSEMMIEEMLGLKSEHCPISLAIFSDNDLKQ